jgi:F-type H+-transporting ATPase subunit gamma
VLTQLVPRYVEARIYQALLESIASEQSARLVAMRNATENAKEMVSELTLSYNKLRQANITKELTEIASGAAALTG